jgi:hypothetical protein
MADLKVMETARDQVSEAIIHGSPLRQRLGLEAIMHGDVIYPGVAAEGSQGAPHNPPYEVDADDLQAAFRTGTLLASTAAVELVGEDDPTVEALFMAPELRPSGETPSSVLH